MSAHQQKENHPVLDTARNLPDKPGVYQFIDRHGVIIYVGKAKNLRKRVLSYFKTNHERGKTALMVSRITDIKFVVVGTETDALLLENNLIKELQPRYNILLKDDKTFPWICIKSERFPRIFPTRNRTHDGSSYYGPFTSLRMMHILLELIRKLYPIRNCIYNLSAENIEKKKLRLCLEYHIGNCRGPCQGLEGEAEYNNYIIQIKEILRGNVSRVIEQVRILMKEHAAELEFEKAQLIKEKLELLEKYQSKSTIVNPSIHNVDVFTLTMDENSGFINYLRVINGSIIQAHNAEIKKKLDETASEIFSFAIPEIRERFGSDAEEILVAEKTDFELPNVKITVPQIGDKKKLIELSQRNAYYYKAEKIRSSELAKKPVRSERLLEVLQKDLRMNVLPEHIECFDNSNIQGDFAVAAMVVFKNGKPTPSEYRHYNIKTVSGPDDYASMEEVVYRRYKRLVEENKPLPQLIVIDGGRGQLNSAKASLEKLELIGKIHLISIAKKLEEIYLPDDGIPLHISKKSETMKVLTHIRNEAHRFGITHHRNKRSKETIKTELTSIPGIGPSTIQKLLDEFKSVEGIRNATAESIQAMIGSAKTKIVRDYFNDKDKKNAAL